MPRRVQDIVPGDRRSIRNIPIEDDSDMPPSKARKTAREEAPKVSKAARAEEKGRDIRIHKISSEKEEKIESEISPSNKIKLTPPPARKKSRGKSGMKWVIATLGVVIVIAGVAFVASSYFSKATFTVLPKKIPVSVNGTYIAQATPGKGTITYELITLRGTASSTVPAVDGPQTSIKAAGKVALYNAYAAQPQRLVAGTRLSNSSGRIYRLTSSIIVPAYTNKSGAIVPGTIMAAVSADQPGQAYNISKAESPGDFKIVAFKGTPKYEAIYARISTDITGGFVGSKKTIPPSTLASTTAIIQTTLTNQLLSRVKATVPPGYIMYDGGYTTTFSAPVVGGAESKSATITVQGAVNGIMFRKSELVAKLAGDQSVGSFDGLSFDTPGLESLTFAIANPKDFSAEKKNTLIVRLKGSLDLVGVIPVEELKKKLAGISLAGTQDVMRSYSPIIKSGSGELLPPWSKVPSDPNRISIIIDKE